MNKIEKETVEDQAIVLQPDNKILSPEIKEDPPPTPKTVTRPPIRKSKFSSGRSWV